MKNNMTEIEKNDTKTPDRAQNGRGPAGHFHQSALRRFVPLLALIATFLWGVSYPLVKVGNEGLADRSVPNLLVFAGARFLISGGLIAAANAVRSRVTGKVPALPRKSDWGRVAALGLTLTGLHYTFMYIGLSNCTGAKSSILKQMGIFGVILLSGLFYKNDRMNLRKGIGCLLGFSGMVLCNLPLGEMGFAWNGEGFVLAASLCAATGDMISKRAAGKTDPILLSGWQQLFGGALLMTAGLVTGGRFNSISGRPLAAFIGLIAASVTAYTLWLVLSRAADTSELAVLKMTIPVFAVLTSGLLLGENILKIQYWAAILLVSAGVWTARTGKKHG